MSGAEFVIDKLLGGALKKTEDFIKPRWRKVNYWLKNESFVINLKLIRIYQGAPSVEFKKLGKELKDLHTVRDINLNTNHADVLYEDLQIPIVIESQMEIPQEILVKEDSDDEVHIEEIETEVKIRLRGHAKCNYRDEDGIRIYFTRIEKINGILDKIFERKHTYENVSVDIMKKAEEEDWTRSEILHDENLDLKINIGSNIVQLNKEGFTNLVDAIKKYVLRIPTGP